MKFLDDFDIQELYHKLSFAKGPLDSLLKRNEEIIEEEITQLNIFLNNINEMTTKKIINEQECVKIYEFEQSKNELLGDEVFLTPENEVVYQIFDEYAYKGFVPESEVIGGFAYMSLKSFMKNRTLEDVINFFMNEPDMLKTYKNNLEAENARRVEFLNKFKETIKK